jgi:CheY-like chemotaxis protein
VRVYAKHDSVQIQIYAEKLKSGGAELSAGVKRVREEPADVTFTSTAPAVTDIDQAQGSMVLCTELPETLMDDCRNLCMCGWHVLCGAERFQSMCDLSKSATWQAALTDAVSHLPQPDAGRKGVLLDLSDGSLLGLSVAQRLKASGQESKVTVVSKELKQFSRLFFSQVADSNDLDEVLLWDGQDLTEISDYLSDKPDDENEDGVGEAVKEEESTGCEPAVPAALLGAVVAVVSECYYYQLQALPMWQALSFYYQVQSLRRQGLLHPQCRVLPGRAVIRAAVFELPNLRRCHGLAGV